MAGQQQSILTVGLGNNGGTFSGTIQNSSPNGNLALCHYRQRDAVSQRQQHLHRRHDARGRRVELHDLGIGAGNITFTGGTLQYGADNTQDVSGQIVGSTAPIVIDTNGATVAFAGNLASSNSGGLTKLGTGMLTLSGSSGYSGTTRIAGGTLQLGTGNPNALPGGAVTANAGVLDLNGNSPTISSLSGAAGVITNSTGPVANLTLNQTTSTTFGGSLTDGNGGLGLTLNGSGMLTLTGVNTYSFTTAINAGVLKAGAANALAPYSDVVVTGGTLDASIGPQSINSLTVGGVGALNLTIGSVLTTNNLNSVNDLFGGTLNLFGATASGGAVDYVRG